MYDNFDMKVIFCNIMIKYKNELVNNLEKLSTLYHGTNVNSIKQDILRCEGFLTLVDIKESC